MFFHTARQGHSPAYLSIACDFFRDVVPRVFFSFPLSNHLIPPPSSLSRSKSSRMRTTFSRARSRTSTIACSTSSGTAAALGAARPRPPSLQPRKKGMHPTDPPRHHGQVRSSQSPLLPKDRATQVPQVPEKIRLGRLRRRTICVAAPRRRRVRRRRARQGLARGAGGVSGI